MTTTPARDNPPQANDCEHYFASHIRGGEPLHVRLCQLCHEPDWADLAEQAAEVRAAALNEAVTKLRAIPVQCTALTGPVWYGAGWDDALEELEGLALYAKADAEPAAAARPDDTTGA